ncbi:hypothetical protein LuPra_02993 [Luteitalea pratensis]|uniref:Uncharacterized protein n=1 Tax=Luteitalea pratensis TaxID=1855912 RepID=A0A143PPM4_LUTPR|nr:hypothetical protein [Luteitalea pratensis]AMY09769.1 hypothetical protein LuPra_02993 [Luteitalea pratensis]
MSRPLVVLVLGVTALMALSWAVGRVIFWLRATFPPNRRRGRRR